MCSKLKNLVKTFIVICTFISNATVAQSPTAPASNFNVFTLGNTTLVNNETEGPIAIGGDLTINGSYQVAVRDAGTFKVNNVKIGLLVNGKVNYQSGNSVQVNSNGYVKIGNANSSSVWYADPNNATPPIKITPNSNYNATPQIMLQANAPSLGVSVINNPVFESNLLDFANAFQTMKATSTSISQCTPNVQLTNSNDQSIPTTNLPSQVKINLQNGINYWNIKASDLNAVQVITFNDKPTASKILVVNVDAAGTFNWNVWNQAGIGFQECPFIMYNFYNTTSLNITNGSAIEGTIYAPFADIFKGSGNQSNIEGQVIANSFSHSGGEVHYALFAPTIAGCAPIVVAGVAPTSNFSANNNTQCLAGNSFNFTNTTTPIQANLPISYVWEFGDGTTSIDANPVKIYTAAGVFNVKLTATNSIGSSSKTMQVTVNASAVANVTESTIVGSSTGTTPTVTRQFFLNNSSDFTSYSWSLNGAAPVFANRNTVTFSFTQIGVYQLRLIGTNINGCSSTTTIPVSIASISSGVAPTANFTVDNNTQCFVGHSFNFTNTTTPVQVDLPITYLWEFGDGTTSTSAAPSKNYLVRGTYNVKLTARNVIGSSSRTMQVTVNSATDASVSQSTFINVVGSLTKRFVLNNSSNFTNYSWSVSNGGTGLFTNQSTVNFAFTQVGVYQVIVTGINDKGCSSTTTIHVSIDAIIPGVAPTSDFSANNSVQCLATNSFVFSNATTPVQANLPVTYFWDFADGTTSTEANPTKVYSTAGSYSVKLTATNSMGSNTRARKMMVVDPTTAAVSQSTLLKSTGSITKRFVLNNSSLFTNYSWSVSNGGTGLFQNQNTVDFAFTQAGVYQVTVSAIDDKGCSSTTIIPVSISFLDIGIAPTANFTVNNAVQCFANNSFTFTNTTTPIQTDLPITYLWNFGDRTTSADVNPTKTYSASGTYNVHLTATNSIGSSVRTFVVTVNNTTSAFTSQSTFARSTGSITKRIVLNNSINFSSYSWSVSNGGTGLFQNQSFADFVFTQSGIYQVTIIGTNVNGCPSTTVIPVSISVADVGVAPTSDFLVTNSTQCLTTNSFSFTNTTTPIQTDLPISYRWDFGDGTSSVLSNPTKVYSNAGSYNVSLTATNTIGFSSKIATVVVNSSTDALVNQNTIPSTDGIARRRFELSNSASFTNYSWSVSNGATGLFTNQNTVNFNFTQEGNYEVTVTGINDKGCVKTTIIPVTISSIDVGRAPNANFSVTNLAQCLANNSFNFTNTTTPNQPNLPLTYLWEFGDGTTSTNLSPLKSYTNAGVYIVKLTASNIIGSSSKTIQVTVNSVTDAIVNQSTISTTIGSITEQFILANSSNFTSYSWSVSNGASGLFQNQNIVNFSFTQAGTYQVTVTGIYANGCTNTTVIPVTIASILVGVAPIANFTVQNSNQCLENNSFNFANTTTPIQTGLPLTNFWEFGDGTTSQFLSPVKNYATAGVYNVKLTTTNSIGSSSKTIQVTVISAPTAVVSQSTLTNASGTLTKQLILSNAADFSNYTWSVSNGGSGLFANQNTVNFAFTQSGYYEVLLTGTNSFGCTTNTIVPIRIASDEVNTGNSGGVESESLGDIMSKQYVARKMSSVPTEFVKETATKFDKRQLVSEPGALNKTTKEFTMTQMFPSTLEKGDVAHITSPTDILNFTIAQEVLSVDFSVKGATKAVVLGVRTKDRVYNHTKASCDRLRSAEILNVKTIKVGGYNFLIQTIKQRNNVTEYAVSFSVGKNYTDAGYTLQSNWFVNEYKPFKDVYNFQVWATVPEQTIKLVNDILENVKSSKPVVQSEIQKLPKTFAAKVSREGTQLVLKLKSTKVGRSIEINMDQNYSETNGFTERYNPIQSELTQTIRLEVGDAYEFDGLIKVDGEVQDAFYHADGNWGLDFDTRYTKINKYRVSNDLTRSASADDKLINRNVNLEVYSDNDYATLYKSLLPGQLPADYNEYKYVSFKAKGSGLMELGLIKSSVENWKHQYKAMINIGEEEQTYYVPFKFFTSSKSKEKINAEDLTMLTFTFLPVEAKTKNLNLTISDVKFTKKAPEGYENLLHTMKNEFLVYPNPSVGNVKCVLFSDKSTTATVSLYDITGKVVHSSQVKLNEGKNELDFNFNVPKGIMLFDISNDKTSFGKTKLVIK